MVDELGPAVVFVCGVDKVRFDKTSIKISKSSLCLIPERDEKGNTKYTATNPSPSSHIPVGLNFPFHNFESKI